MASAPYMVSLSNLSVGFIAVTIEQFVHLCSANFVSKKARPPLRTFREEVSIEPHDALYQVQKMIAGYRRYYNDWRPHTALHYLRAVDYYRGDPEARLAERQDKLRRAAEARRLYWSS